MFCDPKAVQLGTARVMPVVVTGIIAYFSYAITKPLCIDYLIQPPWHDGILIHSPRPGAAVGILVILYLLVIVFMISYIRVVVLVMLNPDYLPLGSARDSKVEEMEKEKTAAITPTSDNAFPCDEQGLLAFYTRDIYITDSNGRPVWCSNCCQFKSDRAHHCGELNRCVAKMDHFCPWVGGVVSETSLKFFIQFLICSCMLTTFAVVVVAVFIAERSQESGTINGHWAAVLALGGLFGLFAYAMLVSSLHLAAMNVTTIENLNRRHKVWLFAVALPRGFDPSNIRSEKRPLFITAPFPENFSITGSIGRQFAIIRSEEGENPFDLGSPLANLKEVLGHSVWEWFLPNAYPPCSQHSRSTSTYRFGPVVDRLLKEYGLERQSRSRRRTIGRDEIPLVNVDRDSVAMKAKRKSGSRHRRHHRHHRHSGHHSSRSARRHSSCDRSHE